MRLIRVSVGVIVLLLSVGAVGYAADAYGDIVALFERVQAVVASGQVVPERDLAPVIDMLRKTTDQENRERVVDKLTDLGSTSGSSPAAVKRYLLEQSTPILIQIAEGRGNTPSLRGIAMKALRDMGAPRPVLQQIADMAVKDPDQFVQSRGQILQNFIKSMP